LKFLAPAKFAMICLLQNGVPVGEFYPFFQWEDKAAPVGEFCPFFQWEDKAGLEGFSRGIDYLFFPPLSLPPKTFACTSACKATTHFSTPTHNSKTPKNF
jgi:hypothetical protein